MDLPNRHTADQGGRNIIPVGQEPPPLHPVPDRRNQGRRGKAKRKPDRRKTANRFAVLNAFVDFSIRDLSRAECLVWLTLFRDTKPDGIARTSQADLARRIGADRATVKRAVAALVKDGLLSVVHRGGLRQGPSSYRVLPLARGWRLPPKQ